MAPFLRYWLPLILYCGFIFAQSSGPVPVDLPRIPGLDKARPKPWMVKLIHRLPPSMTPKPQYPGYLLELTAGGQVRRFVAAEQPDQVHQITAGTVLPASAAGTPAGPGSDR